MAEPTDSAKNDREAQKEKLLADIQELLDMFPKLAIKKERANHAMRALNRQKAKGNMYSRRNAPKTLVLSHHAYKACRSEMADLQKTLALAQELQQRALGAEVICPTRKRELMNMLQEQANSLPLYTRDLELHPPGGVGGIPLSVAHILQEGDHCAAFVDDNWILGKHLMTFLFTVVKHNGNGNYDVKGMEEGDKIMTITKKKIISLPSHRADPQSMAHFLFPRYAIVLALYPQTTFFYKGCVIEQPKTPNDDYSIVFEDITCPNGWSNPHPVPQRYVITYRKIKKAKKKFTQA